MKKIEVIFFDLFYTLVIPKYHLNENENDVIGLSIAEWEYYAENADLYKRRAIGQVMNSQDIINEIVNILPFSVNETAKRTCQLLREERMRNALLNVDSQIIETIQDLHDKGFKIGLISNADVIDMNGWKDSPLSNIFDDAVFSCEVQCLKPDEEIYLTAIDRLKASATNCFFVGDGGSNELEGAKRVGMKTVFIEYLDVKNSSERQIILQSADYRIMNFTELVDIVAETH